MGRGLQCSSGGGSHRAGNEGGLTEKDISARAQGHGTWIKQAMQPLLGQAALVGWLCVYAEGHGREKVPISSFVSVEVSL